MLTDGPYYIEWGFGVQYTRITIRNTRIMLAIV